VIVIGAGVTGEAVARDARARGETVVVVDDDVHRAPDSVDSAAGLRALSTTDFVVPSPGVPPSHPLLVAAQQLGVPVRPEIELAAERASAPIVAITGTNGKTTVTTLVAEMLARSGARVVTAGNIGRPLLDSVTEPADVIVAEVSSFQLTWATVFRPRVAVLLNLAEDHLDWHGDFAAYARAKANVFAGQQGDDMLVYNGDDPAVARLAEEAPARRVPFSARPSAIGYRVSRDALLDSDGRELASRASLPPHADLENALAAAAVAREAGATADAIRETLATFPSLPHRVASVGEAGGVRWIDDSKATNPHAAAYAIGKFDRVVLIAGGRNKGLDLGSLRARTDHIAAVVAIGESADEVVEAFRGDVADVCRAHSMREAVRAAARLARPGDTVLLSPACASFDWYDGYSARGDAFADEVAELIGEASR